MFRGPKQDPVGPIGCRQWHRSAPADAVSKSSSSLSIGVRPRAFLAMSRAITRTRSAVSTRPSGHRGYCSPLTSAATYESPSASTIAWRPQGCSRSHGGGGGCLDHRCGCSRRGMWPGFGRCCANFTAGAAVPGLQVLERRGEDTDGCPAPCRSPWVRLGQGSYLTGLAGDGCADLQGGQRSYEQNDRNRAHHARNGVISTTARGGCHALWLFALVYEASQARRIPSTISRPLQLCRQNSRMFWVVAMLNPTAASCCGVSTRGFRAGRRGAHAGAPGLASVNQLLA